MAMRIERIDKMTIHISRRKIQRKKKAEQKIGTAKQRQLWRHTQKRDER